MNFIIRSLPPLCNSFDLMELFKPFGAVGNARVVEDTGYVTMLTKESANQAMNTLRNPYLKGRRIYIEPENTSVNNNRNNYQDNLQGPYNSWMDPSREMGRTSDFNMSQGRIVISDNDPWRQNIPEQISNGSRIDDFQPESYVYVDPHGYSRDPTMRPAPEYYYRIKLLDLKSKSSM